MIGLTMEDVADGEVAEVTHVVTAEAIREFVAASGDDNPIHSDAAFAAGTRFGRVIAPGMLTGSFISGVIGTRLPGPGTIYLSQSFRVLRPVYVGDRVTARVEVVERVAERNRLRLRTTCTNQDGELLLEGEAWVLPTPARIEYAAPKAIRRTTPAAFLPAALAVEMMSLWMTGGLTLATEAGGRGGPRGGCPARDRSPPSRIPFAPRRVRGRTSGALARRGLAHQEPAVQRKLLAGDVVAVRGDEVDHRSRHLLGLPEAPERDLFE
jgi:3-hydroxybutyryl-CoA dehydratase